MLSSRWELKPCTAVLCVDIKLPITFLSSVFSLKSLAQISSLILPNISSISIHLLHFASGCIDLGPFCVNMHILSQLNAHHSSDQPESLLLWALAGTAAGLYSALWLWAHLYYLWSNLVLAIEGFLGDMVKLCDTSNLADEPTQKSILTPSKYFM